MNSDNCLIDNAKVYAGASASPNATVITEACSNHQN